MLVRFVFPLIFISVILALTLCSAKELKYTDILEQLVDLDSLPLLEEGVRCAQWSSYDRASKYDEERDEYINWGANADSGHYISVDEETGEGIMAEIEGPGCIYRIWSANPQGKIRFYLDGNEKPLEYDFNELFSGKIEPFVRPFVWQRAIVLGGGNPAANSYLPIPFAKSCKVTADKPHNQYYHIGYTTFPKDWKVQTFRTPLTEDEKKKLAEVGRKHENSGDDPQPDPKSKLEISTKAIPAGKEETIWESGSAGTIKQLVIKVQSDDPFWGRNVILKAYWDDSETPAIWCPAGDFFGRAYGEKPYASLPMGMTDSGDYSFWRMPFRKSARIVLVNEGNRDAEVTASVRYVQGEPDAKAAYFHAKWRREAASKTFDYPFLECTGAGKFVGNFLFIDNLVGGWWGEGDEKIYVDGEKFPSTFGTGSEDYYGDAWGIRWFVTPYHGCHQDEDRKQGLYRWHISDSIPFTTEFKMTMENYAAFGEHHNGYTSVAFWYAMPGGTDFFEPVKQSLRLPSPAIVVRGAVEIEELYDGERLPEGVTIIDSLATRDTYSWGRAVRFKGEADAAFPIKFDVPSGDTWGIELYMPDGMMPKEYQLLYKGKPVGNKIWLDKGKHEFTLKFPSDFHGTRSLILDYAMLRPWKNFIRKWMVIGPFDNPEGKHLDTVYEPEVEIDFGKEYEGKNGSIVKWHEVGATAEGFIDLRSAMDIKKLPFEWVMAYAVAYVESPDDREAEMLLGSDDGVKVWLNGELVHRNEVMRGASPDTDRVKVKLKKGKNEVLVKVHQGGGGWGFFLRFTDTDESLKYSIE